MKTTITWPNPKKRWLCYIIGHKLDPNNNPTIVYAEFSRTCCERCGKICNVPTVRNKK